VKLDSAIRTAKRGIARSIPETNSEAATFRWTKELPENTPRRGKVIGASGTRLRYRFHPRITDLTETTDTSAVSWLKAKTER
jgi:hypothetical protein